MCKPISQPRNFTPRVLWARFLTRPRDPGDRVPQQKMSKCAQRWFPLQPFHCRRPDYISVEEDCTSLKPNTRLSLPVTPACETAVIWVDSLKEQSWFAILIPLWVSKCSFSFFLDYSLKVSIRQRDYFSSQSTWKVFWTELGKQEVLHLAFKFGNSLTTK